MYLDDDMPLIHCKRGAALYDLAPGAGLPHAQKKISSRIPLESRSQCLVCSEWTANRGRVCRKCLGRIVS